VSSVASAAPRKAVVKTESVEVTSGENADKVRDVIKKNAGQIKACYDQRLKENPTLSGRLVVDFDITGGRVTTVGISTNTTGDKGLEDCVKSRVRGWRFDPSVEDAVSYPFSLTTQ
jgi:outer membrane biosynthesis protein TonB